MDLYELRYSAEHLWVRLDDDNNVTIGLTEEALKERVEITKIRLPEEGDEFVKDEAFGRLSGGSVKSAGLRLYAPLSGEVITVNEDLVDTPESILDDPYEEGWLVRMDINFMSEYEDLMSREEYDDFVSDDYSGNDFDEETDELDDDDFQFLDDVEEEGDDFYDDEPFDESY